MIRKNHYEYTGKKQEYFLQMQTVLLVAIFPGLMTYLKGERIAICFLQLKKNIYIFFFINIINSIRNQIPMAMY